MERQPEYPPEYDQDPLADAAKKIVDYLTSELLVLHKGDRLAAEYRMSLVRYVYDILEELDSDKPLPPENYRTAFVVAGRNNG